MTKDEDTQSENKTICSERQPEPSASIHAWPVPHIMVTYDGLGAAWGRDAISKAGYWDSRESFCKGHCYKAARDGPSWKKFVKKNASKILMTARFRATNGTGRDEGFVALQAYGWAELIQNVVEIRLVLKEPLEPGNK